MMNEGYSLSDIAAVSGNKRDGDGMFGGDWGAWIILFLIFGLFGRGGFGGFGGAGFGGATGGGQGSCGYCCATKSDIADGFALNNIQSGITGVQQGICDSTYALTNAINGGFHNQTIGMMQGFNGVERGFCSLSHQLSDCCCENRAAIADVKYQMATQACETRQAITDSTRSILDFLTQDKIASLTAENQSLKFAASQSAQNAFITANQEAQTAELIRRLGADCPTPAYVVQPPTPVNFPVNSCGQVQFAQQGCGCGCGSGYGYAA